jgi:SPW repeat
MFSLKAHNVIDYLVGALLIVSPWLFGFADIPAARVLFLMSGIALIGYSLLTNYYYSVARILPLGVHMTLDAVLGVILILAPALLGYRDQITQSQYVAHVVLGIGAVGLVALTKPRTEAAKTPVERITIKQDLSI